MSLPSRLFRVDALVGYGWPEMERQENEHRTFATAQQASDWVAVLAGLPSHHQVLSVHRTDTDWVPVDVASRYRFVVRSFWKPAQGVMV